MQEENSSKIKRIAANIAMEFNSRVAYSIPVKTRGGEKETTINSFKIIVKTKGLSKKQNSKKVAVKKRRINNDSSRGPKYPLNDVKMILSHIPVNVEFHPRPKAQPENLGITKTEAINIIKTLQPSEYSTTSHKTGEQAADVYLAVRRILNEDIEIYIKFYIRNKIGIFVISFHESDE